MIYVVIEGGLVQSVCTDNLKLNGLPVTIVDYDTEGADETELTDVIQDAYEPGKDRKAVPAFVRIQTIEAAKIDVMPMPKEG